MDFVPCPRCQEMNPPSAVKCAACGASMDEEPIEVAPLALVEEPEPEAPEAALPPVEATAAPAPAPAAAPLPTAPAVAPKAGAPPPRPAGAPPLPPTAARPPLPPTAARPPAPPTAPGAPVAPPVDLAGQAAALEEQIAAKPDAKGLYIKLADLHQQAGQKDAAIGVLERLLGVDPGNPLAKHRIDVLRGAARPTSLPTVAVHQVVRPPRPVAHLARRPSRRRLWIGLGSALALVLVAVAYWLLSGPSRLVAGRGPVFSPQGDRIAYFAGDATRSTLNVYDLKTGRSRALGPAAPGFGGEGVAWSPDGRRVAFVGPAEGEFGEEVVFVADVESGAKQTLATGSSPTWSPDGQSVAMFCFDRPRVTATMSTDEGDIPVAFGEGWHGVCLVSVADGTVRRLLPGTGNRLAFSPQTSTLVLERFPEEFPETAMSAATVPGDGELQSLADEALAGGATNVGEGSRDLNRAIEARGLDKRGAEGAGSVYGDLFAIDADTGALTALTSGGRSANPRWTADGRIVYVHQPAGAARPELWVMGADGSGNQPLVRAAIEIFDPGTVAVAGDRVVYSAPIKDVNVGLAQVMTGEEAADLHLVRPGDEAPRRLKNRHTFKQRFTLSPDGRRLVYEANDRKTGESELWLMKP